MVLSREGDKTLDISHSQGPDHYESMRMNDDSVYQ